MEATASQTTVDTAEPAELLEPAPDKPVRHGDAREFPRITIGMCMNVQNEDGAEEFALTRNVSGGGACFVCTRKFNIGEELGVQLRFTGGPKVGTARARLVWVCPMAEGWCHGIAWNERVRPLSANPNMRSRSCRRRARRVRR